MSPPLVIQASKPLHSNKLASGFPSLYNEDPVTKRAAVSPILLDGDADSEAETLYSGHSVYKDEESAKPYLEKQNATLESAEFRSEWIGTSCFLVEEGISIQEQVISHPRFTKILCRRIC